MPLKPGDTLVVGFLGGLDRWDNNHRGVRKLALRLRDLGLPGVHVETASNHRRGEARKLILKALDLNRDGRLDPGEISQARIILYGQSLGGAAVVKLARELEARGVPVLLTVQVDSVGLNDGAIPANVAVAANLYQKEPLSITGRKSILAADPARTRISGNIRYSYPFWRADVEPESWPRRIFGGGHAKMEADPAVWAAVQGLILDALAKR